MRKFYNHNKGKIHPSPPPATATATANPTDTHHLSLLPFAIASLAAALSPEDKEVLAYLLSCSVTTTDINRNFSGNTKTSSRDCVGGGSHPPRFDCDCFSCYTSYWVRWDASPNRQLIHEIIDAYEDGLVRNKKGGKNKKERRKNKVSPCPSSSHAPEKVSHAPPQVEESMTENSGNEGDQDESVIESSLEKGSVRKFVNFIGERIWGVWGV